MKKNMGLDVLLFSESLRNPTDKMDPVDKLTKEHLAKATEFYNIFQDDFIQNLKADLAEIQMALNVELSRSIRKLETKLRGSYAKSLSHSISTFYLEPFVANEVKEVHRAVGKLKERINVYISDFCDNILSENLEKHKIMSLYHYTNEIKALDDNWKSVTSRCSMSRAEVSVKGFHRPQTTWLALGVSKKMKEYGPVSKGL